jgi:hypothetical protein
MSVELASTVDIPAFSATLILDRTASASLAIDISNLFIVLR